MTELPVTAPQPHFEFVCHYPRAYIGKGITGHITIKTASRRHPWRYPRPEGSGTTEQGCLTADRYMYLDLQSLFLYNIRC